MSKPNVLAEFTQMNVSLQRARLSYEHFDNAESMKVAAFECLRISVLAMDIAQKLAGVDFVDEFVKSAENTDPMSLVTFVEDYIKPK